MSIESLVARAQLLQAEVQKAKQNVTALTEQLETSKAQLNMVSGHLNEVAYLIGEERKLNPVPSTTEQPEVSQPEVSHILEVSEDGC